MNLVDPRNRREAFKKETLGPHSRPCEMEEGPGLGPGMFCFFSLLFLFFKKLTTRFLGKDGRIKFDQQIVLSQQHEVKNNSQEVFQQQKLNQKRTGQHLSVHTLKSGDQGEGPKRLEQHRMDVGPTLTVPGNKSINP